jgi:2-polyprenyl-6-methoxyphenol hydroxylase-like FAD-dependent oxidoreductase
MSSNPKRALIIGGGIAGPILALFLQRSGFDAQIFEASNSPSQAGGALGLAPNGMNVLAAAGVVEQARDVSVTGHEWAFENQRGKLLACSSAGDPARYGQPSIMILRAALHKVIVDHAEAHGVPVHFNKRLVTIDDVPGQPIRAHFADGTTVEGDFIVGADGIRSQVRQAVMPEAPKPVYTGMLAPGGFSPCIDPSVTPRSNQRVHFIFGQNGFFGYFNSITPEGPRTLWWSTATSPLDSKDQMAATTKADIQQRLMGLHGDWAYPVPQLIQSATDILNVAIHDVPSLPRWSVGRTIIIGDAAHAVAPHSGQGASMALEDAQYLAKLLAESNGNQLERVFSDFEQHRRPRTDAVIAMGRRNAQRKEKLPPLTYWIQQQMIRIFIRLTPAKKQDWLLGYKVDWEPTSACSERTLSMAAR